jgi:DNA-binding transcriptional MerR regulator
MLTISQLADFVGVTVRAIRHYHQRGLLAEPERDASGYRRYDAQAVIDLIRIKTLAEAGVPLARVEELLGAEPEPFAQAVAQIDEDLAARIRELKRHRRRIAELTGGERLFLPDEVVDFLDELRALGVSERSVRIERDGWIMLAARHSEAVLQFIEDKRALLADPEFQRLYLAYDQAYDWKPDDPRLHDLAAAMAAYLERAEQGGEQLVPDETADGTQLVTVLVSRLGDSSAGWRRLGELTKKKAAGKVKGAGG